jgi:hypothetical protein
MRAHEQAPPDPGFRDRLRALAKAAAAMRDAHARALQAGVGVAARRRLRAGTSPLRAAARDRPPRPNRTLDALRRRSPAAQPGRRRRQPGRRRRRLRRRSPHRLRAGRRATSGGRVTRPALSSGNGWRSEWSPPRVPQARGRGSACRGGDDGSVAWIGAVSASVLPCHGCRSGTGADRLPADACSSSVRSGHAADRHSGARIGARASAGSATPSPRGFP